MSGQGVKLGAGAAVVLLVAVGGFLLWRRYGSSVAAAVNPASHENLANRAAVGLFQGLTGRDDTPGSALAGAVLDVKEKINKVLRPNMTVHESDAQVLTDPGTVLRYCRIAAGKGPIYTQKCRDALAAAGEGPGEDDPDPAGRTGSDF